VASASFAFDQPPATAPTITPPAGTYPGPLQVQISASEPGAVIRYTVDGSGPTATSPRYTGPFMIATTTTVKAVSFAPGFAPSATAKAKYFVT
jgi:Chitobiase/beta-hexosaminidase C-terminal domain